MAEGMYFDIDLLLLYIFYLDEILFYSLFGWDFLVLGRNVEGQVVAEVFV
jgi:hypothetical protein